MQNRDVAPSVGLYGAADLGVAPIVVIGHLQYLHRLDWRTTLAKNAPAVGHALESGS